MLRPRLPELNLDTIPIIIIGGGIAGLAAALALGRRGHRVVVAERRRAASEVGAGLQVSPNASHILHRWGLSPDLADAAVVPTHLAIRRWGEAMPLAQMPFASSKDGAPFWVLLRADLHGVLRQALRALPQVQVLEGLTFTGLKPDGERQRVTFSNDREGVDMSATVVIGADGQWSKVRQALGDSRSLDPPRWEAWRALVPAATVPQEAIAPRTNLWLGREAHAVHYPVAGGRLINLVVIRRASTDGEGWDRTGDPSVMSGLTRSASGVLRELVVAASAWSVWTVRDRAPALHLAQGPVALSGDAAHPVLPFLAQGAALAIEDAEVLALSLPPPEALSAATATTGLERYARARAARVHKVFEGARSNAFAYHLPQPLALARDLRIKSLGPDGMRQRYSWLYDWRSGGAGG